MMLLIELSGKLTIKPDLALRNRGDQVIVTEELDPIRLSDHISEDEVTPTNLIAKTRHFHWAMGFGEWSIWTEV